MQLDWEMYDLPGFKNLQSVFESKTLRIFRGNRREDDVPVVLKVYQGPSHERISDFKRYTERFHEKIPIIPGVADILDLARQNGSFVILTHDPTGVCRPHGNHVA